MTTTGRPSRDVLAVGPATGGVAYVFGHVVEHLGATGRRVTSLRLGTASNANREALRALASVWRAARRADVVHVELGSNDLAVFWFLFWVSLLRRDVVAVAHDVPVRLVKSPGAGLVGRHTRWRLRLAHRVLSPLLDRPVEAVVRRRVDRWGVLSERARDAWHTRVRGRVSVVPHGAEPPTPEACPPARGEFVLFAGYLSPSKGIDVLVDAWQSVGPAADSSLVIAGRAAGPVHEPFVAELRRRSSRQANPPRWIGEPDDATFADLFTRASVVVLPYRRSSPASGVLARAMVEGRCILATDVPAVRNAATAGVDAVVVPASDSDTLARELRRLLDDPALRNSLGRAAAARAARSFSFASQAAAMVALYERG